VGVFLLSLCSFVVVVVSLNTTTIFFILKNTQWVPTFTA